MEIDTSKVEVVDNEEACQWEVSFGDIVAYLAYEKRGSRIILQHTEVPAAFQGKGIGSLLARHALEYARSHGLKAVVHCANVAAYLTRHPEYESIAVREV